MCFSIPKKIVKINKHYARTEDGLKVKLGNLKNIKAGDFIRVFGNIAVEKLSKKEALKTRELIKNLKIE